MKQKNASERFSKLLKDKICQIENNFSIYTDDKNAKYSSSPNDYKLYTI